MNNVDKEKKWLEKLGLVKKKPKVIKNRKVNMSMHPELHDELLKIASFLKMRPGKVITVITHEWIKDNKEWIYKLTDDKIIK